MNQEEKKAAVARAALDYVASGSVLGVGTGSTVNYFVDELAHSRLAIAGAVSSSEASTQRLLEHGIPVLDLNAVGHLDVYVDGADESDNSLCLIKGGGGALTREKIVAAASTRFVCIVDDSKLVDVLGAFPLPIEVVPMAANLVAARLTQMGGRPEIREGFVTDNGNHILDVHDLRIEDPVMLENEINQIAGVVTVGLFAQRPADVLLIAGDDEVRTITV